ncbi:hypothetical protein MLD38_009692 [Melastoma candidum]|uniref:Uncharacterized protein n=1 Tax=Melastoma candidum TaxID=119954 RepID=A0ACB9RZV3_9MYRT|nr:hypothetical protein MLD38_009692 [Melastoma candidum]
MEVPVVDLSKYLAFAGDRELEEGVGEQCREVSRILSDTGALVVKDPRCSAQDNDRFGEVLLRAPMSSREARRGLTSITRSYIHIDRDRDIYVSLPCGVCCSFRDNSSSWLSWCNSRRS